MSYEQFMTRALQLAGQGIGSVSPNPMVGCVIVQQDRIIGEGWHKKYGGPHAEVNAVADAEQKGNSHLLSGATAFVTLEPCSHFGKTPPCADLLISKRIKKVVIANTDVNPLVAGNGISRLQDAGIEVITGVLSDEARQLNLRFFTFFEKKRPYIQLKWAETSDGYIANSDGSPVAISGNLSRIKTHRMRAENHAILIGTNTAINDNPRLNVRSWSGTDPIRIILDRELRTPSSHNVYDGSARTFIFTIKTTKKSTNPEYIQLTGNQLHLREVFAELYNLRVQSVLIEGGHAVLQSAIDEGLWDEIWRCQAPFEIGNGIPAPQFTGTLLSSEIAGNDLWTRYRPRG